MMDAGLRSASALCANNVSPRVTDVTMTPHVPPLVCAPSTAARSIARADAVRGDENDATGAGARAVRTGVRRGVAPAREVLRRRCGGVAALLVAPPPTAATDGATATPPSALVCARTPVAVNRATAAIVAGRN